MVHQRQGLALRLEPGHDLPGVHARLDHLEGHQAAHRCLLLGHIYHPAPAFANLLQELVGADPVAEPLGARDGLQNVLGRPWLGPVSGCEVAGPVMNGQ